MRKLIFYNQYQTEGKWFKGNLHCHTTNSDGKPTPEETINLFKEAGYDFLGISDHNFLTHISHLSSSDFLTIDCEEIACTLSGWKRGCEVLGIDLKTEIKRDNTFPRTVKEVNKQKGLSVVAHPNHTHITWEEFMSADYLGIEIYNDTGERIDGKGLSVEIWDMLLYAGKRVWGFAVSDSHHKDKGEFDSAWIVVRSKTLNKTDILSSIRKGCFYSTQGPQFYEIAIDNEELLVQCSPVEEIILISSRGGTKIGASNGLSLERTKFDIGSLLRKSKLDISPISSKKFFRIEIVDRNKKRAWSNPIYFKSKKG